MGNYYEVGGSTVTKYYYAGAQRFAMRAGSSVYYMLSDQLGSTSITADGSGNKVSEMRYKAWGEVRYSDGTTPTDYTYTGQYSNTDDFGLMFYVARWYDPYLNRWTQPDTIVPDPYNSQSLDRYGYAQNNPVRYTDPSGHYVCEGTETCRPSEATAAGARRHRPSSSQGTANTPPDLLEAFEAITGLTPHSACATLLGSASNPLCSEEAWGLLYQNLQSSPSVISSSAPGYTPDAFGFGIGVIAGYFPAQGTGGVDALYIVDENAISVYGYTGTSASAAAADISAGPYFIAGFNIHDVSDYAGVSNAVNITAAYGHGATLTYFWSGDAPLKPGAPQGITIWYSPGLGASAAYSNVNYTPWITWR